MPLGYGGGIRNLEDIGRLFSIGVEKVIINTAVLFDFELVRNAVEIYGSQSIIVSVNVHRDVWGGYQVYSQSRIKHLKNDLFSYLSEAQTAGAGEIFLNDVDRDGMMQGYDTDLIRKVEKILKVPFVVCGGAGKLSDFKKAVSAGASAVAAGSIFLYHGPFKAVLIQYPTHHDLRSLFS